MTVAIGDPDCEMGHTPPRRPSLRCVSFDGSHLLEFVYVPDHEFIVAAAIDVIRVLRREDIIRDVRAYVVSSIIAPIDLCRHGLDIRNRVSLGQNAAGVNIALHVVLGALPCPGRAPLDAGAGAAFVVCALRA